MKVRDLIRTLQECPPDAVVCTEDQWGVYEIDDAEFLENTSYDNREGKSDRGDQVLLKA